MDLLVAEITAVTGKDSGEHYRELTDVGSVASVFISRWDAAVMNKVPDALRDQLGIPADDERHDSGVPVFGDKD